MYIMECRTFILPLHGARKQTSVHGLCNKADGDCAACSQTDRDSLEWPRYSWNTIYKARSGRASSAQPASGPFHHPYKPLAHNGRTSTPIPMCLAYLFCFHRDLALQNQHILTTSLQVTSTGAGNKVHISAVTSLSQSAVMKPAARFVLMAAYRLCMSACDYVRRHESTS